MTPEILLLDKPNPNWREYLLACQKGLGFSPVDPIDKSQRKWTDEAKYLISISSLDNDNDDDAISLIRHASHYGKHLFFSYLVRADVQTFFDVLQKTRLEVTCTVAIDASTMGVVSGTLFDWKQATIDCCRLDRTYNTRILFDKVYLYFEKLGLVEYWSDCKTTAHTDKTFLLEYTP